MLRQLPSSTLFPYTTLFRSSPLNDPRNIQVVNNGSIYDFEGWGLKAEIVSDKLQRDDMEDLVDRDRKSTRLNSSHANISYAVFCLKKKRRIIRQCSQIQHTA